MRTRLRISTAFAKSPAAARFAPFSASVAASDRAEPDSSSLMNDDLVAVDLNDEGRFQKGEIPEDEARQLVEPRNSAQRRGVDEFEKIGNL